jgi:hypothetical protein
MLPAATLLALAFSTFAVITIADAGGQPLTPSQQAEFVAGCNRTSGALLDCQCLLNRLEGDGYVTPASLDTLAQQANEERLSGQQGTARSNLTTAALACPRSR